MADWKTIASAGDGDYRSIPTVKMFIDELYSGGEKTTMDPLLANIVRQLRDYHARAVTMGADATFSAVTELFQSCNAWIAQAHGRTANTVEIIDNKLSRGEKAKYGLLKIFGIDKPKKSSVEVKPLPSGGQQAIGRKQFQVVLKLFGAIEQKLAEMVGNHDRMTLKDDLVRLLGRDNLAAKYDENQKSEMLNSNSERMPHRIFIQAGLLYRYSFDVPGEQPQLGLLNSAKFSDDIARKGVTSEAGYAPFVMSLDRQFYMREHTHGTGGVYHSNYLGGQAVAGAGTMLVENGVFKGIRGDSGHYQPTNLQIANTLRALRSAGVSLANTVVVPFKARPATGWADGDIQPGQATANQSNLDAGGFNAPNRKRSDKEAYLEAMRRQQRPANGLTDWDKLYAESDANGARSRSGSTAGQYVFSNQATANPGNQYLFSNQATANRSRANSTAVGYEPTPNSNTPGNYQTTPYNNSSEAVSGEEFIQYN